MIMARAKVVMLLKGAHHYEKVQGSSQGCALCSSQSRCQHFQVEISSIRPPSVPGVKCKQKHG